MANILPREKRLRVLAALVDGNSERAVSRMTDVHTRTIRKLVLAFGEGAVRIHNRVVRDLSCSFIEIDEIWGYVQKKEARVTVDDRPGTGEAYTFVALDVTSRLVIAWLVGRRDEKSARAFMRDVRARLTVMPALTSDGFPPYVRAIGEAFGPGVDYAQIVKNYTKGGRREAVTDHRYEPPRDPFITKKVIFGAPAIDTASTAYIERLNLTTRHHVGRMRRLCLAFSKKIENHRAAIALHYVHYNFCHVVRTLRVTPAMAAGIADHVWTVEELMDALLGAAPIDPPVKGPLAPRKPDGGTSRELPNGRGFLRVVPSDKSVVASRDVRPGKGSQKGKDGAHTRQTSLFPNEPEGA